MTFRKHYSSIEYILKDPTKILYRVYVIIWLHLHITLLLELLRTIMAHGE